MDWIDNILMTRNQNAVIAEWEQALEYERTRNSDLIEEMRNLKRQAYRKAAESEVAIEYIQSLGIDEETRQALNNEINRRTAEKLEAYEEYLYGGRPS